MQQIVNFITKYKYFLFFLLLEFFALSLTIKSHSYHRSKFVNSANFISGSVFNKIAYYKEYANLDEYNKQLLEENTRLKNIISQQNIDTLNQLIGVKDTTRFMQRYLYLPAQVINNQYDRRYNYLTLNKGKKDGVLFDQAVINAKGIVGITQTVSNNFSTVQSILNENSKINVRLTKSLHFGTLQWNGDDYNTMQLADLPIQANIQQGDTVITGGKSIIFPEGIPVGVIKDFQIENNDYRFVNIKLFNDMSAIGPVNIVVSLYKEEVDNLIKESNEQ